LENRHMPNEITVLDAQGGGMGRNLVRMLKEKMPEVRVIAAGTNALATAAMLKAGADIGATGENAIKYNCANAKIIIAPIGMMIANSMYGEITQAMASALSNSPAKKILVPIRQSHVHIVGLLDRPLMQNMEEAIAAAKAYIEGTGEI
jgi:hypothetical protein